MFHEKKLRIKEKKKKKVVQCKQKQEQKNNNIPRITNKYHINNIYNQLEI